ncbi:uncharacterized protein DUF2470 [Salinibacterium amurskyense]|uniref:Uncharacterized protein DUF2470 n=1 Tax=Salinibacterium amurskyense TaxID=205941 RepID=A0A2M9D6I5_9MICO|nr:DUF2470 domain-containing protein [Salinibacterium amurskyense]PJJ81133.1 uncharacterized protein DUF2470 [Salinibacterium amurskyense]RLQ83158.1 DUF2470 domain-containing protein [Salinibacterium amurskyense]GHD81509.1 hypothetical protein GCM10007394_15040 [Salinibacterium amurskyense]
MTTFSEEIVSAVLAHMNSDHNDDNLLIVRAFAESAAISAAMVSLDGVEGTWQYSDVDGIEHHVTVPWSTEITERAEIRHEIVKLYDAACEKLGVEARPHS